MASVVLGPGSLTVSSSIGSTQGYSLLWLIIIAAISMAVYTSMGARFGALHNETILQTIASTYGRWFSVLIGLSAFISASSFQFGNNLGIGIGMKALTGVAEWVWAVIFSLSAIVLIFMAKHIYRILEKIMMILVMVMILAFFTNLVFAAPNIGAVAKGFLPTSVSMNNFSEMAALVATTFALGGALYQPYLVQEKGWKKENLKKGLFDANMGVALLAIISMLVIITSAAALHTRGIEIHSAGDMAMQLDALFGRFAKYVFSLGLCAAAFSSLLVNPVIGAGLLSDSLGFGKSMDAKIPKIITIFILLLGMTIAVFFRGDVIYALIIAQAATLVGVPLIAIGMFLVLNNKKIMLNYRNTFVQNIIAIFGFILISVMVYFMYTKLLTFIGKV